MPDLPETSGSVWDLETPVLVVDLDTAERNLRAMQQYCDQHHLNLRPHIKTHKMPLLAKLQLQLGAVGLTVQKLGEAEVMQDAGCEDLLLTYNILGAAKIQRLARLLRRGKVQVTADNLPTLEAVQQAAQQAQVILPVHIEFDSGGGRTGVRTAQQALELLQFIQNSPDLEFAGLVTHPLTAQTAERVQQIQQAFQGTPIPALSVGGTPAARTAHLCPGVTELRVGTYIFNDRMMVHKGAATLQDCALHVHATVLSTPEPGLFILDAGSKTLSSDLVSGCEGYGLVLEYPEATIARLNEEHAMVTLPAGQPAPEVGDRVRIVPNHVCVTVNLQDTLVLHRSGVVCDVQPVLARGKVR
ncbi:alanine racemase [Deinococcus roseus]|uniref:Alanine racemase n=1 Tax=Deinococcus roseus TaxID=392414 RepID=A0ABQ2DJ24_9DEIO|nr:alanine racemase [Deinococcus roseus]GGJ57276.1 alanine racemase [Deinococcus roseus]